MPDTTPCPACGTENPSDAGRCQVCDYDLRVQQSPPKAGLLKCARCGSQVTNSAPFCQVCGLRFSERLPRPATGSLNVRAIFGPDAYGDDAPVRQPLREHTELAPSARQDNGPGGARSIGVAQRFEAPAAPMRRRAPRPQRTPLGTPAPGPQTGGVPTSRPNRTGPNPIQKPSPPPPTSGLHGSGSSSSGAPSSSPNPDSQPRTRRRSAPRPRPNYAGFDAGDSGTSPALPVGGLQEPSYTSPPPSPGDSFSGTPRPRGRHSAHPEPAAEGLGAGPFSTRSSYSGQVGTDFPVSHESPSSGPSVEAPAWGQPRAQAQSRLVLVGRDGLEGESFPIPAHGVEIGRQGGIAFPSDPFVSPRHAHLSLVEGGVHLTDLGSRNGVYVRLTEPAPVYPGDLFLLGNQLLRLDRLDQSWAETPLDNYEVRGFGSPVKPPWAVLVRICVGEIVDDRYHLRGNEMIIGREDGEIVFPSDAFLSRQHARVRMAVHDQSMTVMLEDLGSANGTYLRTRGPATVPFGGMFRVGDQIFRVRND